MFGRKETPEEFAARQQTKQIIDSAYQAQKQGDYASALNLCNAILQQSPHQANALLCRGQCHSKLNHYQDAINDFNLALQVGDPWFQGNRAEQLRKSFAIVYSKLASSQFQGKNYIECISSYRLALQYEVDAGNKGYYHYYLGLAHRQLNNLSEAITDLKNAVVCDSKQIKFIVALAECYQANSNFYEAFEAYHSAIQIDPNDDRYSQSQSYCFKKIIEGHNNVNESKLIQRYRDYLDDVKAKRGNLKWIMDDSRWLDLFSNPVVPANTIATLKTPLVKEHISHFDRGEYEYRQIVLGWTLSEIQHVDDLKSLSSQYLEVDRYYDDLLPLVLEETKAVLRQALNQDTKERFQLVIKQVKLAKKEHHVHTLFTRNLPSKYLEASQSGIALWMTFKSPQGNVIYEGLGLASVMDGNTQIKFMCNHAVLLSEIEKTNSVDAFYLGSLISHERMYALCCEKPKSSIVTQISSGKLFPWKVVSSKGNFVNLDSSQECAVLSFLASPENNLYLLQGPPGTGKTTTIISLIKKCVENDMRVLVTAPSNKAVQEIAIRLLQQLPEAKMMLAGVEEKLSPGLLEIFVHGWHERLLNYLRKLSEFALNWKVLSEKLKKGANNESYGWDAEKYRIIKSSLIKYYPNLQNASSEINLLENLLQTCHQKLMHLDKDEKIKWIDHLNGLEYAATDSFSQFSILCKSISSSLDSLSATYKEEVQ